MKSELKRGFTLIELLVVVAIAGVMLTLTVPAFMDIGRGSRMSGAVSQLQGTINLARQMAITQRDYVTIVFPDDYSQLYSGVHTSHYAKALRSYAVYSAAKGGYISDWRYLPKGIFFVDTYNAANQFKNNENLSRMDPNINLFAEKFLTNVPFASSSDSAKPIPGITFMPNGTVHKQGVNPLEIYLAEGVPLDGSAGKVINLVWKANPVLMGVKVRPFTGTMKIVDYTQLN